MESPEPHCFTRFLSKLHPILLMVTFVILFVVTITFVQKLDNIGSGWDSKKPNMTIHENPPPDWCTPTKPFFYYDLGGTLCSCKREWDMKAYWAKTFTGFAFDFPHVFTPFQIYIVYQRWTWVLIYILFNEAFEEFMLSITGYWGFTYDPPYDLEARYDSFTRDVILCGIPGLLLGIQFVRTFKVPAYLKFPLAKKWDATGLHSKRHHAKVFFQMLVLKQIPLVYNTDFGKYRMYNQNVILALLYVMVHTVNYFWNRLDWPMAMAKRVLTFHVAWAVTSVYMVLYCIYPLLQEAYLVIISITSTSLVYTVISLLREYKIFSAGGSDEELEMIEMESKGLLGTSVAETPNDDEEKRNVVVKADDIMEITMQLQQEGQYISADRLLTEMSRVIKERADAQAEGNMESSVWKYLKLLWSIVWIVLMLYVIIKCAGEPLVWDGIMYRRHWCGVVIGEGGNACIEVGGGLKG